VITSPRELPGEGCHDGRQGSLSSVNFSWSDEGEVCISMAKVGELVWLKLALANGFAVSGLNIRIAWWCPFPNKSNVLCECLGGCTFTYGEYRDTGADVSRLNTWVNKK